jgi:PAS domain S-box-containing protein
VRVTQFAAPGAGAAAAPDDRRLVLALARDVSERVQSERALRRAYDEMETRVERRTAELAAANAALQAEIAERCRAQEALRESEVHFRAVVEGLGEAILITDLEDRVRYCNPQIETLLGYTAAEIVGKPAYELFVSPGERQAMRRRNEDRARGLSERYEVQLLRRDNTLVWTEVHAAPLRNAAGEVVGTLSANIDITARKAADGGLQHSAVLQERNRMAREMHDTLAQAFTGIVVQLAAAERVLPPGADGEEARAHLVRPAISPAKGSPRRAARCAPCGPRRSSAATCATPSGACSKTPAARGRARICGWKARRARCPPTSSTACCGSRRRRSPTPCGTPARAGSTSR